MKKQIYFDIKKFQEWGKVRIIFVKSNAFNFE